MLTPKEHEEIRRVCEGAASGLEDGNRAAHDPDLSSSDALDFLGTAFTQLRVAANELERIYRRHRP